MEKVLELEEELLEEEKVELLEEAVEEEEVSVGCRLQLQQLEVVQ